MGARIHRRNSILSFKLARLLSFQTVAVMLMRLCATRQMGSEFLIHDSHLFDGVDGRQVISALRLGFEVAQELGFPYIVTMSEEGALKETIEGFNLYDYVLPHA